MLYGSLGISIFMVIAMLVVMFFMFRKLKMITPFNLSIYGALAFFWIGVIVFREQLSYQSSLMNKEWYFPLIIASSSLIQVFVRLPLGMLSRKIRSRKIPILLMLGAFVALACPFIFTVNAATFALLAIGVGLFAGTFGMENQYFSENWSLRNIFITVSLVSMLPALGIFIANIFHSSYILSEDSVLSEAVKNGDFHNYFKWVLLAGLIFVSIVATLFYFFNKERKETIRLDNQVEVNKKIGELKLIDVFRMSTIILLISFANQLIFRPSVAEVSGDNWNFIYILSTALIAIIAVITALILIRKFKSFTLVTISQIFTLIGITLGLVMWFANIHSIYLGAIFIFIFTVAVSVYETTMIGVMVHFDNKNKLLVLGIWLTIRSVGYTFGDSIGGEVEIMTDPSLNKWLVLGGFLLVIGAMALSGIFYKKTKVIYDIVDTHESSKSTHWEKIWK